MFKTKVFLLLLLSGGLALNAQSDFRPGYVILTSGDTIRGEINLKSNYAMSKTCIFRTDKNVKETTFSPYDLAEFRMDNGRYFVSEEIDSQGKVFLEFLVKGKLNLYKYSGDGAAQFYLNKEGDTIRKLPEDPEYITENGKTYFYLPYKAMRLLSSLTLDAPELQQEIMKTDMASHRDLVKFTVDYHQAVCKDQECLVYKNEMPFKVSVRPLIGYVWYLYSPKGTIEMGSNIFIWEPVENERLYFKTGLFFGSWPGEFDGVYTKVPIGIRYLGPSHVIRPEISVGTDLFFGRNRTFARLLNLSGALNVSLKKDKLYWTVGGGISTTPLDFVFVDKTFDFVSATAFTGLFIKL